MIPGHRDEYGARPRARSSSHGDVPENDDAEPSEIPARPDRLPQHDVTRRIPPSRSARITHSGSGQAARFSRSERGTATPTQCRSLIGPVSPPHAGRASICPDLIADAAASQSSCVCSAYAAPKAAMAASNAPPLPM